MGRSRGKLRALYRIEDLNQRDFQNDMALKRHQSSEEQRNISNEFREKQYDDLTHERGLNRARQKRLDMQNEQRYEDNKKYRDSNLKMQQEMHNRNQDIYNEKKSALERNRATQNAVASDMNNAMLNLVTGIKNGEKSTAIARFNKSTKPKNPIQDIIDGKNGWIIIKRDGSQKELPANVISGFMQKAATNSSQQLKGRKEFAEIRALERKNRPKTPKTHLEIKNLKGNTAGLWQLAQQKGIVEGDFFDSNSEPTPEAIKFKGNLQAALFQAKSKGMKLTPDQAIDIATGKKTLSEILPPINMPKPGYIHNGKKFTGGNPRNPANWITTQ